MLSQVEIMEMTVEHTGQVANLHISGIHKGFISTLGVKFVTALYVAIAESNYGFGFVALERNKVIGFSSFTTNLNGLYKSIIFKNGFRFMFILAWKMLSSKTIKKIFETLLYPNRIKKMDTSRAEFLSMVVTKEGRGKGLATNLMERGFIKCSEQAIEKIKILARADLKAINSMYSKYGFDLIGQIESHGVVSNVYVANTSWRKPL